MMTSLEAVRQMLALINGTDRPSSASWSGSWPALTYTTDIDSRAKEKLDMVSRRVHISGPERLWTPAVTLTAADNKIEFAAGEEGPANVIRVRGNGKDKGRPLAVVNVAGATLLKDLATNSTTWNTGTTVIVDYVQEKEFDDVDSMIQPLIFAIAAYEFVREQKPQDRDLLLFLRDDAEQARQTIAAESTMLSHGGASGYILGTLSGGGAPQQG